MSRWRVRLTYEVDVEAAHVTTAIGQAQNVVERFGEGKRIIASRAEVLPDREPDTEPESGE